MINGMINVALHYTTLLSVFCKLGRERFLRLPGHLNSAKSGRTLYIGLGRGLGRAFGSSGKSAVSEPLGARVRLASVV